MAKLKINERTVEGLQYEIDHCRREKQQILHENDSLRADNQILLEILNDLTNDESYWSDTIETRTMIFRLKNILNNLKNS